MPRSFSSGALSISSYLRTSAIPFFERTVVIAAVKVVLPWSTCPIVPTFTCGLSRLNASLAICRYPLLNKTASGCFPLAGLTSAHDRDLTGDLVLTKDVLYQLSYMGKPVSLTPEKQ